MSKRSEPKNPFRYGALAFDEAFTDRERELRELKSDIRNGQDVVVFAPRRYGKSSLVLRALQDLRRQGVLSAQVDLMTAPTKEKLAEKLAKAIHEGIASPLYRARERALGVFRGLRITPTVTIDPEDSSVSFGFEPGRAPADVDATIERLLTLPGELAADRGRVVALVLDEFQEVVEIDPNLPKLMRAVFQAQPEVAHVYLGSKRHMMRSIFNDENEPFWRSAKQVELGVIRPDLFAPFIAERFRSTGQADRRRGGRDRAREDRGAPVRDAGALLLHLGGDRPALDATPLHVRVGLEGVLRSEHAHFSLIWEDASAGQRLLLTALAAEPGHPYSEDYRRRHRLPPRRTCRRRSPHCGVASSSRSATDGSYAVVEPFFAEWISERDRS